MAADVLRVQKIWLFSVIFLINFEFLVAPAVPPGVRKDALKEFNADHQDDRSLIKNPQVLGEKPVIPELANVNKQADAKGLNFDAGRRDANVKPNSGGRHGNIQLSTHPDCEEDIRTLCDSKALAKNNFAVLECLQSDVEIQKRVSEKCQHLVYQYKQNLTKDERFENGLAEVCRNELAKIDECNDLPGGQGLKIPCLIEYMDNITDNGCHKFLNKMANIVFGDYRLVYHFAQNCEEDIKTFQCGRLYTAVGNEMHAQGPVIMCLARNIGDLKTECKTQVLRVAELQSDDYHLDRALYYACREAREIFCSTVHAGGGKVFQCLYIHKMDPKMPDQCREQLRIRQSLMAEDVKVQKTFFEACHKDIKTFNCMDHGLSVDGHAARSKILLCLENAMKKDQKLSGLCIAEMTRVRKSLMEDYQITPEVVCKCEKEIPKFCPHKEGLDPAGGTIHCLMQHANIHNRQMEQLAAKNLPNLQDLQESFSSECKATLEDLLKEADVGSDVSVDRVLAEACADVIDDCKNEDKNDVMNCLMEKVDSDEMSEACEDRLLEIQYFVVRNFKMDPKLYKACHENARDLCYASDDWASPNGPPSVSNDPSVFACLHRHTDFKIRQHKEQMQDEGGVDSDPELRPLDPKCEREVHRVMKQRAKSIDLEPEIEDACLTDLGALCSDLSKYDLGHEMQCLQDNYESIANDQCRDLMKEFIQEEDEDLDLDTILMRACTPMIKRYCGDVLKGNAEAAEVMECLIENKNDNDMNDKCRAGIEHHQLIQLKDYTFTHKFKESCKDDVKKHCKNKKSKADIVACLSEIVRDDALKESKERLSPKCKSQLRVELLQMGEDINLNPKLKEDCKNDIVKLCSDKRAGAGRVEECLRNNKKNLSPSCHKRLFQKEVNEAMQGGDFVLFRTCKPMIKRYCQHKDPADVPMCLKNHMNQEDFDQQCRSVMLKRALEETKDYRLNPTLIKACKLDIPKFCAKVLAEEPKDSEFEGKMINCLKKRYISKELSKDCSIQIRSSIKETHLDINMDPVLMHACETQIKTYCADAIGAQDQLESRLKFAPKDESGDRVKNCLEEKLMDGKIDPNSPCGREVSRIVEEVQIDVHIDPELNGACTKDLIHWCQEYESGQGQKMSCLLQVLEDHPDKLSVKCNTLLAKRKTLWEYAAKIAPPETFQEIHQQIMASPSKNYILGVLMSVIGIIFIVGITCGRVTKRVTREQKNK